MIQKLICIYFFLFLNFLTFAQRGNFQGYIYIKNHKHHNQKIEIILQNQKKRPFEKINSLKNNTFHFEKIPYGQYRILIYKENFELIEKIIEINSPFLNDTFQLIPLSIQLNEIKIHDKKVQNFSTQRMKTIEGTELYSSKKNELILINQTLTNKSTNNARQIFAKVPGINVWESDGGGLQLGISARGLSPNRSANFNTRQNHYDIAADALGYPESYYTPPTDMIDKIKLLRGASSLQYGTQFGGVINFILKHPSKKKISIESKQTTSSFQLYNSFNRISGTLGKWGYEVMINYKQGNGWRENSNFKSTVIFLKQLFSLSKNIQLSFEFTKMNYLAKQAGGLTDLMFAQNPAHSIRNRNWFLVDWNIGNVFLTYQIKPKILLTCNIFSIIATRQSLGVLNRINMADLGQNRTLIYGKYQNLGNETKILFQYDFLKKPANLLTGFRLYKGNSIAKQGDANATANADFHFLNPDSVDNSDYTFPNLNYAWFIENIFRPTKHISITPGMRIEYIETNAHGWYKQPIENFAGNIIDETIFTENRKLNRSFIILGIGASYYFPSEIELYSNISQNYRAITFSDIRINNTNLIIDPNISDEKGFNADFGMRGIVSNILNFDIGVFYLAYNNKISTINKNGDIQYRTNIGKSNSYGIETFAELNIIQWIKNNKTNWTVSPFINLSIIDAYYYNTNSYINGNRVEYVPKINTKTGINIGYKDLKINYQFSYVSKQYSDATNAKYVSSATAGIIPKYSVHDINAKYVYKKISISCGINNLMNKFYFTHRATSYPGPGIIPANIRNYYFSIGIQL